MNKLLLVASALLVFVSSNCFAEKNILEAAEEAVIKASELKLRNEALVESLSESNTENAELLKKIQEEKNKVNDLTNQKNNLENRINNASMIPPRMACRGEKHELFPAGHTDRVGCGDIQTTINQVCNGRKVSQRQLFSRPGHRCGYTCVVFTCLNI